MQQDQTAAAKDKIILEQGQRLSRSILWQLQRSFFERLGIEAWRLGTVPYYISSNPYLANAYARLVLGFLRDCHAVTPTPQADSFVPLDPSQPVYIVELGSGSGRLAYHFLRKFLDILGHSPLRDVPIKLIMTDFAEPIIHFWQTHPTLAPFVVSGQLDFARFDAERPQEPALLHSGQRLVPGMVKNPIVLLANYFFDSIPQDCFCIQNGQLGESRLTLTSSQPESDLGDPMLLSRVEVTFECQPISPDVEYYGDPDLDQILRQHQQHLDNTVFSFPNVALQCIRFFRDLAGGRLLLLSADKGYHQENELLGRGQPEIELHGSFSMQVNFHAISQYFRNQGGLALQAAYHHAYLNVGAFLLGTLAQNAVETRLAFMEVIERGGPDDFFSLKQGVEKHYEALSLQQIVAYLRLSGWDSNIFLGCFPTLLDQVNSATKIWRHELHRAIEQVWENYYPIGEEKDLAFCMGVLLYRMQYYSEALSYFQRSLQLHGSNLSTLYNMAMCHYGLRQLDAALDLVNQVLESDPTFEPARAMRIQLQSKMLHRGPRNTNAATA
jgi:tetratricopeptide (TPR) repeat protein